MHAWCLQGIRKTHDEFQYAPYMNMTGTRALHGWSAIGDASNSDDCLGHGTHTAGSVGGLTYGVAKNATLWAGTTPPSLQQQHCVQAHEARSPARDVQVSAGPRVACVR